MALTRINHQGNALTTSFVALVTATSALTVGGFLVRKISVICTSTASCSDSDIHLVADSSTAVALNRIATVRLGLMERQDLDGPWWASSGATVQARAHTSAGATTVRVTAFTESTA